MDARITKEETALLLNLAPSPRAREVEALRLAAMRARDEAIGQALSRGVSALWRGFRAVVLFIAEYPRRRAMFEQLQAMSDRELADIGLERSDLARVFDEDFSLSRAQANREARTAAAPATPAPANSNVPLMLKAAA